MALVRVRSSGLRGCVIAVAIFGVAALLVGGLGARLAWKSASPFMKPGSLNEVLNKVSGGLVPQMREVPGDASHFDPIAAYATARDFAGPGAKLVDMNVRFVRQDGTLDLKASYSPSPGADYSFVREVPRPANAPPPGAGGGSGPWYEPVKVQVFEPGRRVSRSVNTSRATFENQGMIRYPETPTLKVEKPLPDPHCPLAVLWKLATAGRAVPADAVAVVRYDEDGYRFTIGDLKISATFGSDCRPRKH